jgi:hypothetical protein
MQEIQLTFDVHQLRRIKWAAKQEKFRRMEECFFLTELTRHCARFAVWNRSS